MKLTHSRKTSLVLHLEDYTNAGLKQKDMMEKLKTIPGVWMVSKYPINGNVEIHLSGNSKQYEEDVLSDVNGTLRRMIFKLEQKPQKP